MIHKRLQSHHHFWVFSYPCCCLLFSITLFLSLHVVNVLAFILPQHIFDQKKKKQQKKSTFLDPVCLYELKSTTLSAALGLLFQGPGTARCQKAVFGLFRMFSNTFCLTVPAGWEGWRLHQPPRVQNRPSYRVPAEIVSVYGSEINNHARWLSTHTTRTTNVVFPLTAVPSKRAIPKSRASSLPQIVLKRWTGETVSSLLFADNGGEAGDVTCTSMNI